MTLDKLKAFFVSFTLLNPGEFEDFFSWAGYPLVRAEKTWLISDFIVNQR
jgi:hypothetical protein